MAAWLRRNALWLSAAIGGFVFNIVLQKGYLDRVPDPLLGLVGVVVACLFVYGVWHHPAINKVMLRLYSRSAKMLLMGLILLGAIVGGCVGAVGYWSIKKQNETVARQDEKQEAPGEQTQKLPQPRPNIIPVAFGKRHITFDPITQTFQESDAGILALTMTFRNAHERDKEITDAKAIRAHIGFEPFDFYKKLDRTIPGFASVEEGIWLNEKSSVIDFSRGEAKTLVIAIEMLPHGYGGFDAFQHSFSTRPDGSQIFLPRIPKLTADKYVVKVEITGGDKGEIADLNHCTVTLRPEFNISFP